MKKLTDEEIKILKEALSYILIKRKATQSDKILFSAMEYGKEFEKIVSEPMKEVFGWTGKDQSNMEKKFKILTREAAKGRSPGEQFQNAKLKIGKLFSLTRGVTVQGVRVGVVSFGAFIALKKLFAPLFPQKKPKE